LPDVAARCRCAEVRVIADVATVTSARAMGFLEHRQVLMRADAAGEE
jgi:hypothetical protein